MELIDWGNLINKNKIFIELLTLPEILASAREVIKDDIKIGVSDLRNPLKKQRLSKNCTLVTQKKRVKNIKE